MVEKKNTKNDDDVVILYLKSCEAISFYQSVSLSEESVYLADCNF